MAHRPAKIAPDGPRTSCQRARVADFAVGVQLRNAPLVGTRGTPRNCVGPPRHAACFMFVRPREERLLPPRPLRADDFFCAPATKRGAARWEKLATPRPATSSSRRASA